MYTDKWNKPIWIGYKCMNSTTQHFEKGRTIETLKKKSVISEGLGSTKQEEREGWGGADGIFRAIKLSYIILQWW